MKRYLSIISVLAALSFPSLAFAIQTGIGFGGLVVGTPVPCTCSPQQGFAILYTPFFNNTPIPTTGYLYYPAAGAILYMYFQIAVPGTWETGSYTPGGAGVEQCLTGAPPACTVLPTLGAIQYTGTSSLAPVSLFSFLGF